MSLTLSPQIRSWAIENAKISRLEKVFEAARAFAVVGSVESLERLFGEEDRLTRSGETVSCLTEVAHVGVMYGNPLVCRWALNGLTDILPKDQLLMRYYGIIRNVVRCGQIEVLQALSESPFRELYRKLNRLNGVPLELKKLAIDAEIRSLETLQWLHRHSGHPISFAGDSNNNSDHWLVCQAIIGRKTSILKWLVALGAPLDKYHSAAETNQNVEILEYLHTIS